MTKSHAIYTLARRDTPRFEGSTVFRVGDFRCRLTMTGHRITSEWEPHLPGRLNKSMCKQYRSGRDTFLAEVANWIGGGVLVVES